jgi:hypothetical protein
MTSIDCRERLAGVARIVGRRERSRVRLSDVDSGRLSRLKYKLVYSFKLEADMGGWAGSTPLLMSNPPTSDRTSISPATTLHPPSTLSPLFLDNPGMVNLQSPW